MNPIKSQVRRFIPIGLVYDKNKREEKRLLPIQHPHHNPIPYAQTLQFPAFIDMREHDLICGVYY